MASVLPEPSVIPLLSARSERSPRPTGMRNDGGFASMMDEARPDRRPTEKNQMQPRERVKPSEQTQAPAAETQDSQRQPKVSQEAHTAPASGETTPASAQAEPAVDGLVAASPADGATDEAVAAMIDGVTPEAAPPEAPVVTPVAAPQPVAPEVPVAPVTVILPPQATQNAPDMPLPDAAAEPALPVSAAPALAAAPETPVGSDSAPAPAPADAVHTIAASNAAPAQPGGVAPLVKTPATNVSGESAEAKAQSVTTDAGAETAAPGEEPKQSRSVQITPQATPERQDAAANKPALQPDVAVKPDDAVLAAKPGIDPSAPVTQIATPAHAATPATTAHAVPVSAAQPVPVNAVAVEIAAQMRAGNSRFEIRLDPAELGRIDVRLDIDREGNVTSRLVIERADTYDLLRRDQSTLERALQQAGLKTSDNALEFSLRDQGAQRQDAEDKPRGTGAMITETEVAPNEAANGYARLLGARGGLDIRV